MGSDCVPDEVKIVEEIAKNIDSYDPVLRVWHGTWNGKTGWWVDFDADFGYSPQYLGEDVAEVIAKWGAE